MWLSWKRDTNFLKFSARREIFSFLQFLILNKLCKFLSIHIVFLVHEYQNHIWMFYFSLTILVLCDPGWNEFTVKMFKPSIKTSTRAYSYSQFLFLLFIHSPDFIVGKSEKESKREKSWKMKISAAFIYLPNKLILLKTADKASDFHTDYFYFFERYFSYVDREAAKFSPFMEIIWKIYASR